MRAGAGAGALLGPGGLLAGALPGWEDRPEQRTMADAVEAALCGADPHPLLVEAGTGTGKTLAYLLPAALSGRKVIISTGTRALQEQLTRHDIPLAEKALGRPIASAVLKGVSNYVCRRRAGQLGLARVSPELDAIRAWLLSTETGDRSEMGELGEDSPWWQELTTTPEGRLGPKCPHHEACFVTRARRAAEKADLIVVNHHLFFADLALRGSAPGARVLPDYDAVVFDEAHLLEDVMTEHFGFGVSTVKVGLLARELGGRGVASDSLQRSAADFFGEVSRQLGAALRETRIALPEGLFADASLQAAWFGLDGALEAAEVRCAAAAEDQDEPDEVREEWAALSRRGAALRTALANLAEGDAGGGPAVAASGAGAAVRAPRFVKWAEARAGHVYLKAAPIDVSRILGERVLSGVPAAVMTSATLTCAGSFRYLRDRLGLGPEAVEQLRVDSPFDYSRQALLYVARDLPAPGDASFVEAACRRIAELVAVTGGGAFALFTSHRALREAERRMPGSSICRSWCRARHRRRCCWSGSARARARCCWRPARSGPGSTCRARPCGWSSWTSCRSRRRAIRWARRGPTRWRRGAEIRSASSACRRRR